MHASLIDQKKSVTKIWLLQFSFNKEKTRTNKKRIREVHVGDCKLIFLR